VQTTVRSVVTFEGAGLHSGKPARVIVRPAPAEHGVWFERSDIKLGDALIPARWDMVEASPLCTRIVNSAGSSVSTIEHLMAALAGCGIHNARIEIDGPEVPILDGSARPFVEAFLKAGVTALPAPVRAWKILKPVRVETDQGWAQLSPAENLSIDFHISFADAAIGAQTFGLDLANGAFVRELCDSRTFCRKSDVDAMQAQGLALGGIPGENAVVFDGDIVVSPGGLRRENEPVRHKMLDALGDLALAGRPILGRYEGHKAGHAMTNALLRKVFADSNGYAMTLCDQSCAARLPGAGAVAAEIPRVA
jgi:UDP-3-O-[3-hydroxymyristoyl] N-acetylglucosamine deacetylase